MPTGENASAGTRAGLIETIRTPLGFFALVILVAEALLGIVATMLTDHVDPAHVLFVMVSLIFFLIVLVATFALFRPEALYGRRLEVIAPSATDPDAGVEQVRVPHILCASTAGTTTEELERYVAGISLQFADADVMPNLTVDGLRLALQEGHFQAVHLVTQITGGEEALRVGEQQVTAGDLRNLLDTGSVRLLVLTACDSLSLACELARVANVVLAPTTALRSEVVSWSDNFYRNLARGLPVSRAYSSSSGASRAPVTLILTKDVRFTRG